MSRFRVFRSVLCAVIGVTGVLMASPARAQSDTWEVDAAPLYLWAAELNGRIGINDRDIPVFMSFADAADSLAGVFSFHVEARKNRWGVLGDINFIRLSTDASFITPVIPRPVEGNAQLDMTVFEAGASYLVAPKARFSAIGGIRTYTMSPAVEFTGAQVTLTPIDASNTSTNVFGGFLYRPKLSEKWTLDSRLDIGAGEANFTWSGTLGLQYRFKPWGGVMFGYHALGIDTGNVRTPGAGGSGVETSYDVTHYGPVFAMTLHWKG